MRLVHVLVAASWAVTASGQLSGTYYSEGSAAAWSVNPHQTLIWDGLPYLPVGLRIDGTKSEIDRAKAAGFNDVIVELPVSGAGWEDALAALEANDMRYLISVNSLAAAATGVAVEPQGYRVTGITQDRRVEFPLPGCTSALAALVTQRDETVQWSKRVAVEGGRFVLDVEAPNQLEHVLLVYPITTSLSQPDFWESWDGHRDALLTALRRNKPGKGLRGIVNPAGELLSTTGRDPHFVPTSAYFRMEFRSYLVNRYRNIETAQRAWSLSVTDIDSFDALARLVPLWSGSRGIGQLWDPVTDRLYRCEPRRSSVWTDIEAVVQAAAARRYDRLIGSIRQVADVPVIQDWYGWSTPYEREQPALTGVGMRVSGLTPSALAATGSRAASSLLRWSRPGWLVATEVDFGSLPDAARDVEYVLDDLGSMGARAWFARATSNDALHALADQAQRRAVDSSYSTWSVRPIFFPENALNPAMPQRLPGGAWWLPSPAGGNRIDLGTVFHAYRYSDGAKSFTAIWTSAGSGRVRMRMLDPKSAVFSAVDGSDPAVKLVRGGIELNIGQTPTIISGTDEIPIPEIALAETTARIDEMLKIAGAQRRDVTEEGFLYRDAGAAFERNPAGSFMVMRAQYWRLNQKLGDFVWLEAESPRSTNFSEVVPISGVSGGRVLGLRSPVATDTRGYFAEYQVAAKTEEEVEVWIAGKIPADQRANVRVMVGSQILHLDGEPRGQYGSGFGWYRAGVTRLRGLQNKVSVEVLPSGSLDLQIDAIVFYPGSFNPNGILPPDAIVFRKNP